MHRHITLNYKHFQSYVVMLLTVEYDEFLLQPFNYNILNNNFISKNIALHSEKGKGREWV